MLEYLNSLKRSELLKLMKKFGTIEYGNSITKDEIVEHLSSNGILREEEIELISNGETEETNQLLADAVEKASLMKEANLKAEGKDENVSHENKKSPEERAKDRPESLADVMLRMRRKALEPVVVTITPLDTQELGLQKDAGVFSFTNQFFTKSVVVPYNVKQEVPRCIAEVAMAMRVRTSVANNPEDFRSGKTTSLSTVVMRNKYNVIIHTDIDPTKRDQ